jgi:uncharacterized membrane protein YdjX (TVP38/TMEM64 family)
MSFRSFLSSWRLTLARILALAVVIAITAYIFSIRDQAEQFKAYGYPGIFILSILANATVILPAPGIALTFALGAIFNPVGVALASGTGAAIGELTGYLAGFSGQAVFERSDLYERLIDWTKHYGGWTIFLLALIPNPLFDLGGAAAGALRMPIHKFLLWAWLGKTLKMLLIALAGDTSIDWLQGLLNLQP